MINLARASLALVLRAIFGGAKNCAIVNVFMICPNGRLVAEHDPILYLITAISWHA